MTTDIATRSLWDRFPRIKPYALLARWDRPIGFWLVFWPASWSMLLAPDFAALCLSCKIYYVGIFALGAFLVRGAGCTVNDMIDRRLDAGVARTKTRPLASGALSVKQAVVFLVLQLLPAAVILFTLPPLAIAIGLGAVPLIALYPLMKRVTWWPQAVLALVFNTGTLVAWAAFEPRLTLVPLLLYVAAFCWTMGYDTVYACMDRADDARAGMKSTALLFGTRTRPAVLGFWLATLACFAAALAFAATEFVFPVWLVFGGTAIGLLLGHLRWQPDHAVNTLAFFRMQARIGFGLALAALTLAFHPLLF